MFECYYEHTIGTNPFLVFSACFRMAFPEPHNEIILDLLFVLCTWHALAKLRLHTSSTLQALKATTKALGQQLRYWVKKTCSVFDTQELPEEESAWLRCKAAAASKPDKGKETANGGRGQRGRPRGSGRGSTLKSSGAGSTPTSSKKKVTTRDVQYRQGTPAVQYVYIQGPCSWSLCCRYCTIWDHRQLFHSSCTQKLASRSFSVY
jgi:hypothetical protein